VRLWSGARTLEQLTADIGTQPGQGTAGLLCACRWTRRAARRRWRTPRPAARRRSCATWRGSQAWSRVASARRARRAATRSTCSRKGCSSSTRSTSSPPTIQGGHAAAGRGGVVGHAQPAHRRPQRVQPSQVDHRRAGRALHHHLRRAG
jgi:hypothetical protein